MGSSGTPQLPAARPCPRVGILPFQPDLTGSFLFAPLAPARSARQALPATLLLRLPAVGARTFLPYLAIRAAAKRAGTIVPPVKQKVYILFCRIWMICPSAIDRK